MRRGSAMKKTILLIGNFFASSLGSYSVCEDLCAQLTTHGWPVLITSKRPDRVVRLLDMLSTVWLRRKEYAIAQVDVYSGHAFLWAEIVCQALYWMGKPYILTLHGGNLPAFARRWPGRVRHILNSAVAVTTPSRYLLEQMRPYRTDLRLLPNPLDLREYRFIPRSHPQPHLIWLRAFHEIYNPALAVQVAVLLARDFPNLKLFMIGPDKGDGTLSRLRQCITRLGLGHRVLLPGAVYKTTVPDWLNQGDIFLNTSNVDNTPVSILEALACGLCVVSTNVGGISYLLEHEGNALLVPPNDPEAMALAVRRLLMEPGLAGRLSYHARMQAECFDWSTILPQWEALLTSTAEAGWHE
jgi:glycosyltransferase involved in cell wall biosynthesis